MTSILLGNITMCYEILTRKMTDKAATRASQTGRQLQIAHVASQYNSIDIRSKSTLKIMKTQSKEKYDEKQAIDQPHIFSSLYNRFPAVSHYKTNPANRKTTFDYEVTSYSSSFPALISNFLLLFASR